MSAVPVGVHGFVVAGNGNGGACDRQLVGRGLAENGVEWRQSVSVAR